MCFFHRMVTAPSRVIILRHFKEAEPQEVNPHSGKAPRALQGRRDDVLEPENPVSARRGRQGPTSTHTLPREQPCGRGVSSKVGAPPHPIMDNLPRLGQKRGKVHGTMVVVPPTLLCHRSQASGLMSLCYG